MKVKEYIQWLLPSRKWRVLAIIITGVIVGGGALTLYMLRAHTYLTDDPAACVNCHIMGPYYATWFHSSHSRNATCNDCHVPHENAVKKWVFKGMDGMRHVAVFLTHGEKDVVRANGESSEVIMNNCIRCHGDYAEVAINATSNPHKDNSLSCVSCHSGVGHKRGF